MAPGPEGDEWRRGHDAGAEAGRIEERLAGHDRHFAAINGSLARVGDELHSLTLAVQRLSDQAVSRDATVVTTAAALKDAEDARRAKGEQTWSPLARITAILGGVATVIGIWIAIRGS